MVVQLSVTGTHAHFPRAFFLTLPVTSCKRNVGQFPHLAEGVREAAGNPDRGARR